MTATHRRWLVPRIPSDAVPAEQFESLIFLDRSLHELASCINDFENTLSLFEECIEQRNQEKVRHGLGSEGISKYSYWALIPASHGAILLSAFDQILARIVALINTCPAIVKAIDHKEKRKARSVFSAHFPSIKAVRNTVAHPFELSATPESLKEHAAYGGQLFLGGGLSLANGYYYYSATFNKRVVGYAVSRASLAALEEVASHMWKAFEPIERPESIRQRAQMRESPSPPSED